MARITAIDRAGGSGRLIAVITPDFGWLHRRVSVAIPEESDPMADRWLDCDSNRLRRFLDGAPDEGDLDAVAAHLDDCEACRARLEAMAADGRWWAELRRFAPGQSRDRPPFTGREGNLQADPPDFLDPPNADGFLGQFGPYPVIEVVGRGGMGVVLKAFDPALHRIVAIKVLAPRSPPAAAARSGSPARPGPPPRSRTITSSPSTPSTSGSGLPYMVMHYVAGRSLQERLDRTGPLSSRRSCGSACRSPPGWPRRMPRAWSTATSSPPNILLENGVERVKITDFGLARAADDASLTQSGVVAGTPQYMSPEQARGETIDHRADLFSLGSVLYAMAAGRPPFRAETTMAVLRRVCDETAPAAARRQPRRPRLAGGDRREAACQGPGRSVPVGRRGRRAARAVPGPSPTAEAESAARIARALGRRSHVRSAARGPSAPHRAWRWPGSWRPPRPWSSGSRRPRVRSWSSWMSRRRPCGSTARTW